jgi:hypothetical protein
MTGDRDIWLSPTIVDTIADHPATGPVGGSITQG